MATNDILVKCMLIILKSQRKDHHYSSERKKTNRKVKDSQHNVMVSKIVFFFRFVIQSRVFLYRCEWLLIYAAEYIAEVETVC